MLELIAEEAGAQVAARIEARARVVFGGMRFTVSKRKAVTPELIDAIAPGKPKEAAKALGVHPTTVYRVLQRPRLVR